MKATEKHFHGSDLEAISKYYDISEESIINYASNVSPYGLSEKLKIHLSNNINAVQSYPDRDYVLLRKKIAEYCKSDSENIIVGNGCSELIDSFISAIKPKKTLIVAPTYSEYAHAVENVGGKTSYFFLKKENDFKLDLEELKEELNKNIDLLVICNPNNPTSKLIPKPDIENIVKYSLNKSVNVIIDETYIEFVKDYRNISAAPLTDIYDNLTVLRGTSKFFCTPGLRLGYAITGSENLKKKIKNVMSPWAVSSLAEKAGEFMFSDYEYINDISKKMNNERIRMYNTFKNSTIFKAYVPEANFMLLEIKEESINSGDIFEKAIHKGLMIRDCSDFIGLNESFIRFCFLLPEDNDKLTELLLSLN